MIRRSVALSLAVSLSLAGCNCGVEVEDDAGVGDAGQPQTDAGPKDAGGPGTDAGGEDAGASDAGLDAGLDASVDGGSADGGLDDGGLDGGCGLPAPTCQGVCASTPPVCGDGGWACTGPGFQAVESRCDGFDNDCDGQTDEGCATCTVDLSRVNQQLGSKFDIDFDSQCNTYLTTLISGTDFVDVVPASSAAPVARYRGNANQNMGYALVDPDPATRRVVVTYSCCTFCNCQAKNGLTLLFTCDGGPGCGCSGQATCPGFLDAPFLASSTEDTSVSVGGAVISTPTGLAAGPGNTYFVGNWRPETCSDAGTCTACDPAHPGSWCSATQPACCDTRARGRLAQFTLGDGGAGAQFRVVAVWPDQEILSLATTTSGDVLVATRSPDGGALLRYSPSLGTSQNFAHFPSAVLGVTQHPPTQDVYVELLAGTDRLRRLAIDGGTLPLPAGIPANPDGGAQLQIGPDGRLYRLAYRGDGDSGLSVYTVP